MYDPQTPQRLASRLHQRSFNALYNRSLLYNQCWEDPALDRVAMELNSQSEIVMITSAGCNALDYALDQPKRIHAVDANPRQTALLELKIAGIRTLEYEDFWQMFGLGVHPDLPDLYHKYLRKQLSPDSRMMWDSRLHWWSGRGWRNSLYYYGLSGLVARLMSTYIKARPKLRRGLHALFRCEDLSAQSDIFINQVEPYLTPAGIRWLLNRQTTMHLLGVPQEQGKMVSGEESPGVAGFVREALAYVCQNLPIHDNYFWRVYVEGCYSHDCCPEYLKPDNFLALKNGAVDCIRPVTTNLTAYLREYQPTVSHAVLLDHMDWMGTTYPDHLAEEWHWLLKQSQPGARVLFRSGAREPDFLNLPVTGPRDQSKPLQNWMTFNKPLAERLHRQDRVHTYSSFFIGDMIPEASAR